MYLLGQGVARDPRVAASWFSRAVSLGDPGAMYNLAAMYAQGSGVVQDLVSAYMLLSLSSSKGNPKAANAMAALARRMPAAQVAEAQRRAAAWLVLHS
jgi:TPR repeat protein